MSDLDRRSRGAAKSQKDERVLASRQFTGPTGARPQSGETFIADVSRALYCAKIVSYAQGFTLMRAAAKELNWNLSYGSVALMWRGGCIIRSRFLGKIKEAFDKHMAGGARLEFLGSVAHSGYLRAKKA